MSIPVGRVQHAVPDVRGRIGVLHTPYRIPERSVPRTMWPDPSETEALLRRVAEEGEPAAGRLWERHREPLRRMIGLRLDKALGRRVDASDVVQEVLLKANQRLSEYLHNPVLPFHLWLRQIARDHMIDEHRRHRVAARPEPRPRASPRRSRVPRSLLDRLAAQLRDPGLTPAAMALRRELERRFQEALGDSTRGIARSFFYATSSSFRMVRPPMNSV